MESIRFFLLHKTLHMNKYPHIEHVFQHLEYQDTLLCRKCCIRVRSRLVVLVPGREERPDLARRHRSTSLDTDLFGVDILDGLESMTLSQGRHLCTCDRHQLQNSIVSVNERVFHTEGKHSQRP